MKRNKMKDEVQIGDLILVKTEGKQYWSWVEVVDMASRYFLVKDLSADAPAPRLIEKSEDVRKVRKDELEEPTKAAREIEKILRDNNLMIYARYGEVDIEYEPDMDLPEDSLCGVRVHSFSLGF